MSYSKSICRRHGSRAPTAIGCTLCCRHESRRRRDHIGGIAERRWKLSQVLHLTDRIRQALLREIWAAVHFRSRFLYRPQVCRWYHWISHQTTYTSSPGVSGCRCFFFWHILARCSNLEPNSHVCLQHGYFLCHVGRSFALCLHCCNC